MSTQFSLILTSAVDQIPMAVLEESATISKPLWTNTL